MEINNFIKKLRPSQNEIKVLQSTLNSITTILQKDKNLSIVKVYPAGSFKKGTMLKENCEADIIYIVNKNNQFDKLFDDVFKLIKSNFQNAIKISKPHKSIKLKIKKKFGILNFDILPAFEINSPTQLSKVNNPNYFSGSSTKFQIEYVIQQKKINSEFGDIVRLLKYWNKKYNISLSGFQLELIVANAMNGEVIKKWDDRLLLCFKTMQSMSSGKVIEPINWKYYTKNEYKKDINQNAWIVDPGNPKNNVAGNLTKKQVKEIGSQAHKAINAINMNKLIEYLKIS